ncbi:MAG: DUF4129 domain-containing protein, partial [Candidatus Thorarchaeota archaeon]
TSISIVLFIVSGLFIVMMVAFVMIDFFRKRNDEFHEQIVEKDVRWLPKAAEEDHRKRIIRAYHKASYDLIDHGATSEKSMTPGEFEENSIKKFEIKEENLRDLTDLYEEARFSEHEIVSDKSSKAEILSEDISTDLQNHELKPSTKSSELIEIDDSLHHKKEETKTKDSDDKEDEE